MNKKILLSTTLVTALLASTLSALAFFDAGFETTDTPSYTAGEQLHHAGGVPYRWGWAGSDIGLITTDPNATYEGAQGLNATRSTTINSQYWWTSGTNAFARQESGIIELGLAVKTVGWTSTGSSLLEIWAQGADVTASDSAANRENRSAWLTLTGNGNLVAYTNNSAAITVATGITVSDWNTFRVQLDLDQNTYDVFLNNTQVANDFTFYGSGADVSSLSSLQFKEYNAGQTTGGVFMDSVYAIPEPSTFTLLSIAFGALLTRTWYRHRA